MYSVLIADNETHIRDDLKRSLDWEAAGFSVCWEAADGEEALRLLCSLRPDLALIAAGISKMPGLSVIGAAKEQGAGTRFIILGGSPDPSAAREAVRRGVEDWLEEPVDKDALSEAVSRIKRALDREALDAKTRELFTRRARNVILRELITGETEEEMFFSPESLKMLELDADVYQVVICENFNPENGGSYRFADLLKVTNREEHTFHSFETDQNTVVLLKGTYALNRFHDFLEHYHGEAPPQKGSPMDMFFLAYGRPVRSAADIHLSYEEASRLISRRFFCSHGCHTLGYEEPSAPGESALRLSPKTLAEYADTLTGYLQTFNRRSVSEALRGLENDLYNVNNDAGEVKLFLTDLYLCIKEKIRLIYPMVNIPFPSNSEVITLIRGKYYLYEIMRFLWEQSEAIMNATGNPGRNNVLDDILYYIDHNYRNNIKLETIAPLFGYNSAYLGKIFTQTVGENFNSYVDRLRIEHSKRLLLENQLKVYEVAEQAGYRNVDYFHKKFRKYVGESPAEFRKKYAGKK